MNLWIHTLSRLFNNRHEWIPLAIFLMADTPIFAAHTIALEIHPVQFHFDKATIVGFSKWIVRCTNSHELIFEASFSLCIPSGKPLA